MLDEYALKHWVSASQHETYVLCPRKWGYYKLDGIAKVSNKYAERGSRVHAVAELWLRDGVAPDLNTEYGKIFSAGIKYLPPPGGLLIEQKFSFQTENAVYVGTWDVLVPFDKDVLYIQIVDHKTTSGFKWIKTSEDLKTNIQSNIYAVAVLGYARDRGVDIDRVILKMDWVYYLANEKNPRSRLSRLYVAPDVTYNTPEDGLALYQQDLLDQFDKIDQVSVLMLEHHRQGHKASDLDCNIEGCNAYGGCPYRGNPCVLTMQERMRGYMAQQSLQERIAARKAAAEATAAATPVGVSENKEGISDLAARIAKAKAGAAKSSGAASPEAVAAVSALKKGISDVANLAGPAVNPPGEAVDQMELPAATFKFIHPDRADRVLRATLASNISAGVIMGGVAQTGETYENNVAVLSLAIADAILARI